MMTILFQCLQRWVLSIISQELSAYFPLSVRPWQDGRPVRSVSPHRHAVAAELVERRARRDRATLPAECIQVLRRIQRPPGQRVTL